MTSLEALSHQILKMFRGGRDTLEIARALNISESRVSRLLWVARCRDRGLPATFLTKTREIRRVREV